MTALERRRDQLPAAHVDVTGWTAVHREFMTTPERAVVLVRNLQAAGRLVGTPRGRRLPDGRALLALTVLEPPARRRRVLGRRLWWVLAGLAAGVLAAVAYVVVTAVAWVLAHLAVIAGVLVVLAALTAATRGRVVTVLVKVWVR